MTKTPKPTTIPAVAYQAMRDQLDAALDDWNACKKRLYATKVWQAFDDASTLVNRYQARIDLYQAAEEEPGGDGPGPGEANEILGKPQHYRAGPPTPRAGNEAA